VTSNAQPPTAPAAHVTPGTLLAGKYRVERVLGQGGMGVVVEARHLQLDERVALKFLLSEYAQTPEASARFVREARAAVKIKSPHVARVSDVGTLEGGAPYMVMEFLEGSDISQLLEKTGVLPIADAIDFTIQGCEAIAEAHSYGIVHRDLKPANLFLTRHTDGTPLVKVLDFGISKVMNSGGIDALTRTTAAMGSALYMSPEQMQQTRSVDHRTDIYALGVALYEMLGGKQPFFADTLPQLCAEILTGTPTPLRVLRPDIPEQLAWSIEKAYARDRAHRYQSIAELVIALAPWAPARSQPTIDRVARMAGMPSAVAGQAPAIPPRPGPGSVEGGVGGDTGPFPGPPGPPGPPPPGARTSNPVIVPGPYAGPSSSQAKAAFARSDSAINAGTPGTQSRGLVVVALAVVGTIAVAAGLFMVLRARSAPTEDTSTNQATSAAVELPPPPPETAAPAETQAPTEVVAPTASASASGAEAKTTPPAPRPTGVRPPVKPTTTAAPTTKPTTAPKGKNAEDYR
jgi:serine/threonine-protein kinase